MGKEQDHPHIAGRMPGLQEVTGPSSQGQEEAGQGPHPAPPLARPFPPAQ